jgi:hypothetical protein
MVLRNISRTGDGIVRAVWTRNAGKTACAGTPSDDPPFDQGDSRLPTVRTRRSHVGGLVR